MACCSRLCLYKIPKVIEHASSATMTIVMEAYTSLFTNCAILPMAKKYSQSSKGGGQTCLRLSDGLVPRMDSLSSLKVELIRA